MSDNFGDSILTITDEDGKEYVLEVLATLEMDGSEYYALVPYVENEDETTDDELEVSILKAVEEDGEEILCAIEDEDELERVYNALMELEEEEDEEDE